MPTIAARLLIGARERAATLLLTEALVAAYLCTVVSLSIHFTRLPAEIALFWSGCAIAAALLTRSPRRPSINESTAPTSVEREPLRITLDAIGDAVITTDAASRITYVNAAAQALLGLSGPAAAGRRVDDVIHLVDPQTTEAAANLIAQSTQHARIFRREQPCLLHRADGSVCHVLDVVTPVMDANGALSGLVIVFRDASIEVARSQDLEHRAFHDPLTGLSNRADFVTRLHAAFEKSQHSDRPAAVIAIDLDQFKAVNDSAGHAAGDAVLCKVAKACRDTVRSSDTVARLGGDEFAIILTHCGEDRAQKIARQLLRALNPITIEWSGVRYAVNASLGLAVTGECTDENAWLDAADQACLRAKRDGRSRLRLATHRLPADNRRRVDCRVASDELRTHLMEEQCSNARPVEWPQRL